LSQDLKSKGTPIPVHDIWIAALAMEKESILVTLINISEIFPN
jgi:predicted nucleic acid-binding protein